MNDINQNSGAADHREIDVDLAGEDNKYAQPAQNRPEGEGADTETLDDDSASQAESDFDTLNNMEDPTTLLRPTGSQI